MMKHPQTSVMKNDIFLFRNTDCPVLECASESSAMYGGGLQSGFAKSASLFLCGPHAG